jgi:hypothetical protein
MHGDEVTSRFRIAADSVETAAPVVARSNRFHLRKASLILLSLAGLVSSVQAQPGITPTSSTRPTLALDEIVSNLVQSNLQRARALGSYEGTRVYRLEYKGFPSSRTAEMVVNVKYRSPDSKEFTVQSEKGSKLILDKVFKRMLQSEQDALTPENQSRVALNKDNYAFELLGTEAIPSGVAYVLSVKPRNNNKLLYRGKIWVDASEFAVVRIDAAPAKNPSFWTKESRIEQTYSKIGNFWLPLSNRSTSSIRLGGHALLTIDYRDYKITASNPMNASTTISAH